MPELDKTLTIEGTVCKKVCEDYKYKFFKIETYENSIFRCMTSNKHADVKMGMNLKVSGVVVRLEENGETNYYINSDKILDPRYVSLQGLPYLHLNGDILKSEIRNDTETIFTLHSENNELYPCFYEHPLNLIEGDTIVCEGNVIDEGGYCMVNISFINLRANFDLHRFILKFFQDRGLDFVSNICEKISELDFVYGSVESCFQTCSKDLETFEKTDINYFIENVFGDFMYSKQIEFMFLTYRNHYIYRPFEFFGINKNQVDEMEENGRELHKVYEMLFTNPARIPELRKQQVDSIFSRMNELQSKEQENAGNIARYVYESYKFRKWTSVAVSKLQKIFPTGFEQTRHLLQSYDCSEQMDSVYFTPYMKRENYVAKKIAELMTTKTNYVPEPVGNCSGKILSENQKQALYGSLENSISIITGAAGTGKTKILSDIGEILVRDGYRPLYAAYVGAAVQRIKAGFAEKNEEIMSRIKIKNENIGKLEDNLEIMTIHLAIAMKDRLKDLKITHVIFDECSMIDIGLLYNFMKATNSIKNLKYIFVGDINQLEPISAGNIMSQFLKCGVKVFRLTENFRNERGILELVETIIDPERIAEFRPIRWREYECPEFEFKIGGFKTLYDKMEDLCFTLSDEEFRNKRRVVQFLDRITVVTYLKKTCNTVNRAFQEIFLQNFRNVTILENKYYEFDRMMNLKNNYSMKIMNGEIGKIIELSPDHIVVRYKDNEEYDCVYISPIKHALYKKIIKLYKISYSIYGEDVSIKPKELIRKELNDLCTKTLNVRIPETFDLATDIQDFFELGKRYPKSMFITPDLKYNRLAYATQAYCITVRKAQGSQFPICICFHPEKNPMYVNRRSTYTELSRAKKKLILIVPSEEKINSIILKQDTFVYDNLWKNIANKLPEELKPQIQENEIEDDCIQTADEFTDDYDDIDLDDIF